RRAGVRPDAGAAPTRIRPAARPGLLRPAAADGAAAGRAGRAGARDGAAVGVRPRIDARPPPRRLGTSAVRAGAGGLLLRGVVLAAAPPGAAVPGVPRRRGRRRAGRLARGLRRISVAPRRAAGGAGGGDGRAGTFFRPVQEGNHVAETVSAGE